MTQRSKRSPTVLPVYLTIDFFNEALEREVSRAQKNNTDLSLILLDIDYFKQYNDSFGHIAGDEAIELVAQVIKDHLRAYDIPARYGGEEFAIILPGTSMSQARQVAERLRAAVESETRIALCNKLCGMSSLTVSIGIAYYTQQANTSREMIQSADKALYLAKAQGRNQVREAAGGGQ